MYEGVGFSGSLLQRANMPWLWTPSLFWLALYLCMKGLVFQGVCYNVQRRSGSERQAHLDRPERVPRVNEVRFLWDHWTPLCSTGRESKLLFVPVMLLCILILSVSGVTFAFHCVCFLKYFQIHNCMWVFSQIENSNILVGNGLDSICKILIPYLFLCRGFLLSCFRPCR